MTSPELHPIELMQRMAEFFEAEGIAYRVVGSRLCAMLKSKSSFQKQHIQDPRN